jgi:hypothetical protein
LKNPDLLLFLIYKRVLQLYPTRFRSEYEQQVIQTLRDAHGECRVSSLRFWFKIYGDLVKSVCVERIFMMKQPIVLHAISLGVILTLLGGLAAVTIQQMLRRGADQPQIEMVDFYVSEIESGLNPNDSIPSGYVDLERNLEPFVIFYDELGKPEKATGYLDQSIPAPPPGVFEYVRDHGSEKFTWQPARGVRIAAVARHIAGSHPGFLLCGRSLRIVEADESLLRRMAFFGWVAMVLLLVVGAILLQRARPIPHTNS